MKRNDSIILTQQDRDRLANVVSFYRQRDELAAAALREELERADVVPASEVPRLVVTMNSRVACRDDSGTVREVTIVYPWHADPGAGKVSVLEPLGRALLGAGVGDTVDVAESDRTHRCWIYALHYQPEAAGRLDL